MRHFFFLTILLFCVACATQKAATPTPVPLPTSGSPTEQQDTTNSFKPLQVQQAPPTPAPILPVARPTLLRKLTQLFVGAPAPAGVTVTKNGKNKCRGCITHVTYNNVTGNQENKTTTTTTTTGKKANGQSVVEGTGTQEVISKAKGPAAQGQSTAKDQSDAGIASDITGDNNAPQLTNTQPVKKSMWEVVVDNLTSPLGYVIGIIVLILFIVWRVKRKTAPLV